MWKDIIYSAFLTLLRVTAAVLIALSWTLPLGVRIGMNPKLSKVIQPIVQIVASVPATAIFPVIVMYLINLPGGLNIASIVLMLLGTQWYLLFNIIAGGMSIPNDLIEISELLKLSKIDIRERNFLPAKISLL